MYNAVISKALAVLRVWGALLACTHVTAAIFNDVPASGAATKPPLVLVSPENAAEMTAANVIDLANSPTALKPEYVLLGHPDSTFLLAGGGRWAPEDLTGVFSPVSGDQRLGTAAWSDRLMASLDPGLVVRAKVRMATTSQSSRRPAGTFNSMQSFAIGLLCTWFALYLSLWLRPARTAGKSPIPPGYFKGRD